MKSKVPTRPPSKRRGDLRNMPIRQKLALIVMITTAGAFVLAGIGIVVVDLALYRSGVKNDLAALSHIISDNTTAALAFDDPGAASETLAALRARPHVMTACVFRESGLKLAAYTRSGLTVPCPSPEFQESIRFAEGAIIVSSPIVQNGRRLGTLVLVNDLGGIYQRLRMSGVTVFTVFLFSTVIALFLSARLRSMIAEPILDLAAVTTQVSNSRDYSIRAEKISGDELGLLGERFNEMLAGIQLRDSELRQALLAREEALEDAQKARDSLEATLASVAQLNGELRTSNARLARSNEDLERFAFIASHDLQEPLRMITIYSQLLVRLICGTRETAAESRDPSKGQANSNSPWRPAATPFALSTGNINTQAVTFVEHIESGAKRMRELLADLLAYAEIGARPDQPAEPVDFNLVVEKVRENLAMTIAESGTVIRVGRLPVVRGFESHFIPLFQNLIGNAIKYRSEQTPQVDISAGRMNGFIQICVSDNGMGIAPEYHSKIFVAFKRLHGKKIPGTGIGLAICQRVVERYGGRIWVESELGQGANFIFTLPADTLAI